MRELTLDGLLEAFAARTPAPGGGAGAGVAAALGAALAEMGARFAGLEEDARRAAELRALALELAEGDAAGYAPVLEAIRLPAEAPERAERLRAALSAAAEVPLALAEAAAEVAALARRVAAEGRPALAGDALDGRRARRARRRGPPRGSWPSTSGTPPRTPASPVRRRPRPPRRTREGADALRYDPGRRPSPPNPRVARPAGPQSREAKGGAPLGRGSWLVEGAPPSPALGDREAGPREAIMTRKADFKRRVRDRMARTGESYAAARVHVLASRPDVPGGPMTGALHVTNGDATVPGLLGTGLVRDVICWADALHEGPVPDVPDEELRRIRAAFLAGEHASDLGTVGRLASRDATLAAHREGAYVLWFEADLYDQLQVVQILATLAAHGVDPARITLICIGEHLGIAHFGGLGELSADQLRELPAVAATALTTPPWRTPRARGRRCARPTPTASRDRREPVARAALRRRGVRAPRPGVPLHARRAVAHRAAPPRGGRPRAAPPAPRS